MSGIVQQNLVKTIHRTNRIGYQFYQMTCYLYGPTESNYNLALLLLLGALVSILLMWMLIAVRKLTFFPSSATEH